MGGTNWWRSTLDWLGTPLTEPFPRYVHLPYGGVLYSPDGQEISWDEPVTRGELIGTAAGTLGAFGTLPRAASVLTRGATAGSTAFRILEQEGNVIIGSFNGAAGEARVITELVRQGDTLEEPFRDRLLVRLMEARIRNEWRPYAAAYVIVSALNSGAYDMLFRAIKSLGEEIKWEQMSPELLRRIFEVAIINDELSIAKRALAEISTKSVSRGEDPRIKPLRCLIEWRAGRIQDESTVDLELKYFVVFPAYDEYFKGRILSSTGRLSEAKTHFQRCLDLAPRNAQELREDVLRRM